MVAAFDTRTENRPRPGLLPGTLPRSEALQREVESGRVLKQGARGAAVSEAQSLLQAHGFSVGDKGVDGKLGPDTRAALTKFQQSRGIDADGAIGPDTLRELRTPTTGVDARRGVDRGVNAGASDRVPGMTGEEVRRRAEADALKRNRGSQPQTSEVGLAPRNMSEREKFDYYSNIVKQAGGQVNADGKPTVLGIRGQDINGNKHDTTSARAYNDTFVVLTPDKRVLELKGSTHSGQVTTSLVNHVGRINEGNYSVSGSIGDKYGKPKFHVKTLGGSGNIPAVRDLNDDGRFSANEKQAARQRGTTQDAILFHTGTNSSPHSIGCMTMPPAVYDQFVRAAGQRGFSFTLVDAYR
jgi:peptidoglycan hydrolase-like protein with peptidoglycan-binding domain